MLDLNDICMTFHPGTVNERRALDHVSLHLNDGDFVCVLGSNGAGKSTLLNAISGSLQADTGTIVLDGIDLSGRPEHVRSRYMGRLFQDPMRGTAPDMSIVENLGLAYIRGKRMGLGRAIRRQDRAFFRDRLAMLGLGLEDRMDQPVGLLSGGQRQALTLLMATIVTPKLLLLDEHTAALDPKTAAVVMELTQKIVSEHHITTIMITHNLRQSLEYGNKMIIMNEGRIVSLLEGEEKRNITIPRLLEMYDLV